MVSRKPLRVFKSCKLQATGCEPNAKQNMQTEKRVEPRRGEGGREEGRDCAYAHDRKISGVESRQLPKHVHVGDVM